MQPIDLTAYADRYRVRREPGHGQSRDPWLVVIPCRYGHLHPHSAVEIGASVDGHPQVANRLRKLPGVRVLQDGDHGELNVSFPPERLADVAAIMRPRKRRRLSPEQRARLVAAGKSFRRHGAGSDSVALESRGTP